MRVLLSQQKVCVLGGLIEGRSRRHARPISVAGVFEHVERILGGKVRNRVGAISGLSADSMQHEPDIFGRRDWARITDHLSLLQPWSQRPVWQPMCGIKKQ